MKLSQFKIGKSFWMSGKKYLCTDIGIHVVVAALWEVGKTIEYTTHTYKYGIHRPENLNLIKGKRKVIIPRKWYKPPYTHLHEIVILDYEFDACTVRRKNE